MTKRFARTARQVSELAAARGRAAARSATPSIADRYVAEATLHLKGATLRAHEASPEMLHSIHELAEDIRRQVKRHREKRRGAAESRRAVGRLAPHGVARGGPSGGGPSATLNRSWPGESSTAPCASARAASSRSTQQRVEAVNRFEPELELLDDAEIRERADELRQRAREDDESLDDLLPEAFALVREAGKRSLGQRHYDVQLIGGMVLHVGRDRRDEDRRGQDPDRDPRGVPRTRSPATASTWSPSTTTSPAATRCG